MSRKTTRAHRAAAVRPPVPQRPPHGNDSADRPRRVGWARALAVVALTLATLAAFSGVLSNGWIELDDPWYVTGNRHVNTGLTLENVIWFLGSTHGGNWHPVTSISHMLDVELFGLDPGGHHAVSLALHALNVLLLFHVLHRLTGAWWRSLIVAGLFGLHPLRVESVAWAAERKDVLSMLFFLLTLEAYRRWVLRPGRVRYLAVMVALALGLMSKPMLVTTPVILLLLDVWPLGRLAGLPAGTTPRTEGRALPRRTAVALIVEKWPLLALSAAAAAATLWAQSAAQAVMSTAAVPVGQRLANAVVTCWRYVTKTFWPADLIPFYPDERLAPALVVACTAGFLAVTALALAWRRRRPHVVVGWGWYIIALLPVIGLIQVGGQAYADRYTYLPSIGLLLAIVWLPLPKPAARAAALAALLAIALLGVLTWRQVALWKDTETLFSHTLRVSPGNTMAHHCLALVRLERGDLDGAIDGFQAAIASHSGFRDPYRKLAEVLNRTGRHEEALRYSEAGMRIHPDAGILEQAARAQLGLGRPEEAVALFRRSLEQEPYNVDVLRTLAIVRSMQGHAEETVPLLQEAERLDPQDPYTQYVLGKAVYLEGEVGPAIERLRRAAQLKQDWAAPRSALALILAAGPDTSLRDPAEAVRLATRAVELTGGTDADALQTRAVALAAAGRLADAAAAARAALSLAEQSGPDSLVTQLRARVAEYESHARSGGR